MPYIRDQYSGKDGHAELRTEDVSRISFQLLDAVAHCANHRVLHRDIKPENCMFQDALPGSALRLIDFGSGCMDDVDPAAPSDLTMHTTFAGSAFYISPEMFQRTYTLKTDVWSVGVTLYVLVAGYPADKLQRAFNLLQSGKDRDLRKLPSLPDNMPDSYYELLEKLCTYRHKKRPAAKDMLNHEFVQFHKTVEGPVTTAKPLVSGKMSRTASISLVGSVERHAVFLGYQKFERGLTTALATLLSKEELGELLRLVDKHMEEAAGQDKKLQVIPVTNLKEIIEKDLKNPAV